MNKKQHGLDELLRACLAPVAAISLLVSGLVFAQESDEDVVDEITVTGTLI